MSWIAAQLGRTELGTHLEEHHATYRDGLWRREPSTHWASAAREGRARQSGTKPGEEVASKQEIMVTHWCLWMHKWGA